MVENFEGFCSNSWSGRNKTRYSARKYPVCDELVAPKCLPNALQDCQYKGWYIILILKALGVEETYSAPNRILMQVKF